MLASGGDPHRGLHPASPAARTLAADLDHPSRRDELTAALGALAREANGLEAVRGALRAMLEDDELAWHWLACALLAAEVTDDEA